MNWKRAKLCLSPSRLTSCRRLFQNPWRTHLALAFLTRWPAAVTLKNGRSVVFSRAERDHLFWDWLLSRPDDASFDFTDEGEIQLTTPTHTILLRPRTTDFFIFSEIFLQDCYKLQDLPARLGTVVDLGGNVGLFTCAVLPRADRVITVEAVEAHCRLARRNILHNGGDPRNLLRFAVTATSGQQAVIHLAQRHAGASSLFAGFIHSMRGQEVVPTISLEDLLDRMGCAEVDLLKCDVEGAEFDIFLNTPQSVLRCIQRLVMEVHVTVDADGTKTTALVNRLRDAGLAVAIETPPTSRPIRVRMLTAVRA
jgi:FkbM family methyltransferase